MLNCGGEIKVCGKSCRIVARLGGMISASGRWNDTFIGNFGSTLHGLFSLPSVWMNRDLGMVFEDHFPMHKSDHDVVFDR